MTHKNKCPSPASIEGNAERKADATIENHFPTQNLKSDPGQQLYRDRFGHPHTSAVFQHWHPQIIAFFDLTLVGVSS